MSSSQYRFLPFRLQSAECDDLRQPIKRREFGLKELAPGDHPVVDIVAIHGINGDREDSWTADNGILWLRDILPEKIPNARILTYGYDANTHGQEQLATEYMHDHAMNFISKLALLRQDTSATQRPIIFVAHSSGGILLKSALIHSHITHARHLKHHHAISRSTRGIAFFGTPHLGSATAELAQFLLDIRPPAPINTTLLQHLRRDSETLQHQLAQYSAISNNYETKFFYELYDTQVSGRLFRRVVPKSSAVVPGAVNAEAIGVYKDHVNMVRFPSAADEDFRTVSTTLSLMSKTASQNIFENDQTDVTHIEEILSCVSLSSIPRVQAARFDADGRPRCLKGTRVKLLRKITDWIEVDTSREKRRIFWLCGQAGTGKTTVSLTVASNCQKKSQLAASFFFSRDHADRNDLTKVFPTLAHQLGVFHGPFKSLLAEVLRQDPDLVFAHPIFQFEKLITGPLKRCHTFPSPAIIVIDALDECADENPISKMLSILSANIQEVPGLKFFIASRPENHIVCGFRQLTADALSVILHDIEASIVDDDIERYLRDRLSSSSILYPGRVGSDWPAHDAIKLLVGQSGRLFIFAATAMNFILDSNYSDPQGQLDIILGNSPSKNLANPFASLDHLYLGVLRQAFPSKTTPSQRLDPVKSLLGAIVVLRDLLSPSALETLLSLRRGDVRTTLRHLHSVIVIPDGDDHPIRLIHPSFFDFVTSRCSDPDFQIDSSICHDQLAIACFEQMKGLKRDVCNIQDPSKLNSEIMDLADRLNQCIPPSMQYACRYWSYHLCNAGNSTLIGLLETFCHTQMLYWVEALSLIDSLRDGIRQINNVIGFLRGLLSSPKELLATLKDIARFIADHFEMISVAPLQLYRTALPLSPKSIYTPFEHEAKGGIQVLHGGESCASGLTTLYGPGNGLLEFSQDGKLIISTSDDTIFLWDTGTGTLLKKLYQKIDARGLPWGEFVWAMVSADSSRIISATAKYILQIWNVATGVCLEVIQLKRLHLATTHGPCYAGSPDSDRIVGTERAHLLLWNNYNGAIVHNLRGHTYDVRSLAFSPSGLFIASGSLDSTIRLWDANNGATLKILIGHSSLVTSVTIPKNEESFLMGETFLVSHGQKSLSVVGKRLLLMRIRPSLIVGILFNPLLLLKTNALHIFLNLRVIVGVNLNPYSLALYHCMQRYGFCIFLLL